MKARRIHITGASGSGTTTLGRAVAGSLGIPHHDTDDYLWLPTDPPYRNTRARADRIRLMQEMFLAAPNWVLSGSLTGWGDELIPYFDLVIFLSAPTEVRVKRLRDREASRFGIEAVASGGWRFQQTEDFVAWASRYDEGDVSRTCADHEIWLSQLSCPVLRLDSTQPLDILCRQVLAELPA